jgi:hypothetical protein
VKTDSGDALGHADHGKTAAAHYVGAAATVPVLRVLEGSSLGSMRQAKAVSV